MLMGNLSNLCDRLDRTDLIICKHNTDQYRIGTDCFLNLLRCYETIFIHIKICDLITVLFQILAGMQDRMMLDLGCNDMFSFGLICLGNAFQHPVVRLTAATGKINLCGCCPQRIRNHSK